MRKRKHDSRPTCPTTLTAGRRITRPRHIDVPNKRSSSIEYLNAVGLSVTHIHQPVIGNPQTVRQRRDVAFFRDTVEWPLPKKRPRLVDYSDPLISRRSFTISYVNITGAVINVDTRRKKKLRSVGIERSTLPRAINGIVDARFSDLEYFCTTPVPAATSHTFCSSST